MSSGGAEAEVSRRARVLHLSGDFPDPFDPGKTNVFKHLLDLTRDRFDHQVVSINRATPHLPDLIGGKRLDLDQREFEAGLAVRYHAPPLGIYHANYLDRLGDWLVEHIARAGTPDLLVGHKLTIEGLAVERAAARLELPYALALQGNTDLKILHARPGLRDRFRAAYHGASEVLTLAPWTVRAVEELLGARTQPARVIPAPVSRSVSVRQPRAGGRALISAFHLGDHRNKNLAGLARAMRMVRSRGYELECGVAGGGDEAERRMAEKAAFKDPRFRFLGHLSSEVLTEEMNNAIAFILPSRRESFGLVFIEALMSGAPIVYPDGEAVAGWFDKAPFALAVNPNDTRSIASAIEHAVRHERSMKAALAEWQQSQSAQRFSRAAIARDFASFLDSALDERSRAIGSS